MVNYPVGDFLIRIKNAASAGAKSLVAEKTVFLKATAEALKRAGFIEEIKDEKGKLNLKISFKKKTPLLMGLELVSKPGLRIYLSAAEIEKEKGPSVLILSTPKGVLTSREAVKQRLGGEIIAKVW